MKIKRLAVLLSHILIFIFFTLNVYSQDKAEKAFKQAKKFIENKQTENALTSFEEAISLMLKNEAYSTEYIGLLSKNNLFQRGKDFYTKLSEENPQSADVLYYHGRVYIEQIQVMMSDSMPNMFAIGNVAMQGTDFFTRALATDSMHVGARLMRGISYSNFPPMMGLAQTAVDDLSNIIERFKNSEKSGVLFPAYQYLGEAYKKLQKRDEAIKVWNEGLKKFPDNKLFKKLIDSYQNHTKK